MRDRKKKIKNEADNFKFGEEDNIFITPQA